VTGTIASSLEDDQKLRWKEATVRSLRRRPKRKVVVSEKRRGEDEKKL
jgi:hypothetical protein